MQDGMIYNQLEEIVEPHFSTQMFTPAPEAQPKSLDPTFDLTLPSDFPDHQDMAGMVWTHHNGEAALRRRVSISNGHIGQLVQANHKVEGGFATNDDGIPQTQLIYNNQVIFNPDGGPIHGTSAWKKQKLLERNRVAASKCRQRKKSAQEKLRMDVERYVKENGDLLNKVSRMEKKILQLKHLVRCHFDICEAVTADERHAIELAKE